MKPDVFDHRDRSLVPPGVRRPADTLRDVLRRVDDTGLDRPPNGFGDRAPHSIDRFNRQMMQDITAHQETV